MRPSPEAFELARASARIEARRSREMSGPWYLLDDLLGNMSGPPDSAESSFRGHPGSKELLPLTSNRMFYVHVVGVPRNLG